MVLDNQNKRIECRANEDYGLFTGTQYVKDVFIGSNFLGREYTRERKLELAADASSKAPNKPLRANISNDNN
jgi:hypothetical protein